MMTIQAIAITYVQRFSIVTKQYQPAYRPQKSLAEQPSAVESMLIST
jgi:hypothetical protein